MNLRTILLLLFVTPVFTQGTPTTGYLSDEMRELQVSVMLSAAAESITGIFSGKGLFSELPNASADATAFVQEVARDHGISPEFQVKISDGYAAGIGTILLPENPNTYFLSTTLDASLYNYNYGPTSDSRAIAHQELMEHIGSLDHEFTHYKNHDMRTRLIFTALLNTGLVGGYFCLESAYLSSYLKSASEVKKWVYALCSGLGLSATSFLINKWLCRYQERRADEGVRNDRDILNAKIAQCMTYHADLKNMMSSSSSRFWRWVGAHLDTYPWLYYLYDPEHPSLLERKARFEQRLLELEKTA